MFSKDKKLSVDPFYLILGGVFVVIAILVFLALQAVITGFQVASEVNESLLESSAPHVNKADFEEAFEILNNKDIQPLDLRL